MFQNFTGSSRRQRQVNLSGQNLNPFATHHSTQETIAHAQQERIQRQLERNRQDAARKIQRAWRVHRSRHKLLDSRRKEWDANEACGDSSNKDSMLSAQLKLLLSFFDTRRRDDVERTTRISSQIVSSGCGIILTQIGSKNFLFRVTTTLLAALESSLPECPSVLLQFLLEIIEYQPLALLKVSKKYYQYFSRLCCEKRLSLNQTDLLAALKIPLARQLNSDKNCNLTLEAYASFSAYFLTTPDLDFLFDQSDDKSSFIDLDLLSSTLSRSLLTEINESAGSEGKIWLLAYFILFNRQQKKFINDSKYLKAFLLQLSGISEELLERVDNNISRNVSIITDTEEQKRRLLPLPSFVQKQLIYLVARDSVSDRLISFSNNPYRSSQQETSLIACYILSLLRLFPSCQDEVRMWLYLESISSKSGVWVPTLKFFWEAMRATKIFSSIKTNSEVVLNVLRRAINKDTGMSLDNSEDGEWHTILLFLELYAFVLRFTDDEEFLSGSAPETVLERNSVSRLRQSALPIDDVKDLILFLKNLAFAMYYNAFDLLQDTSIKSEDNFRIATGSSFATMRSQTREPNLSSKKVSERTFAGIMGNSYQHVRNLVTGVMSMLYERDSRRNFLPKDHWLMTIHLNIDELIPVLLSGGDRQQEFHEDDEDEVNYLERIDRVTGRRENSLSGTESQNLFHFNAARRVRSRLAEQNFVAAIEPRIEVLQNMPFVMPFETRVLIFREFVKYDREQREALRSDSETQDRLLRRYPGEDLSNVQISARHRQFEAHGKLQAKIRRNSVFEDAYSQLYSIGDRLKDPFQINFVDQFDTLEAGIDGGGVTKEFLTCITNEALCAKNSPMFFIQNDHNLLYPNPTILDEVKENLRQEGHSESSVYCKEKIADILQRYEFLGRIIGKCLYEGILVDIGFAGFFLLKWSASRTSGSDYRVNINDLRDLDESLYQGLLQLKNTIGNVEDFSLDFTIVDNVLLQNGQKKTIIRELVPNGSATPVTNENRPLYVSYVARHRLQVQPYQQTQAFLKGLSDLINPTWISMFNQSELQILISGDSSKLDIEDLRRNTLYGGVYQIGDDGEEHETIKLFWKVMESFDDSDRRKFLKFATSSPRGPLLGFSELNPLFSIRDSGSDGDRLPSTSTCVNLLKLPRYTSELTLKQKLLYAINAGAGFDLS